MDSIIQDAEAQSNASIEAVMNVASEKAKDEKGLDDCPAKDLEYSSDAEEDLPFEPYDINGDGRIMKIASQRSRQQSWKRPEPGWDVSITVHSFCELVAISAADDAKDDEGSSSSRETCINKVEPNLQLEFRLGEDEHDGFAEGVIDQAKAAGVELNTLLHSGIETMSKHERATFAVSRVADGSCEDDESKRPCRMEYDISLDAWTEEIDLSNRKDGSLVKRIMRDGNGVTEPVEIGMVTVRCRITRKCAGQDLGEETVVFDNLQSQDDPPEESDALEGPLTFVLDDCPFGPGVAAVVKSMREGELCEARLGPEYALGETPHRAIEEGGVENPGDDRFQHHATVELLEVEELAPLWSTDEVRLKMSKRFKLEGNEKFAVGDYVRALRRYEEAIKYADGVPPSESSDDDEGGDDFSGASDRDTREKEIEPDGRISRGGKGGNGFVDLQVAILCNQTACHLKLGDAAAALEVADRASTLKAPTDSAAGVKAAYRRACALEAMGEWDEARHAFKSVLEVDPKNTQCSQGLARIARAEKAYRARLRKAFGGCLASGKLEGFASEGREAFEPIRRDKDDQDPFDGRRGNLAEAPEGPRADGSESGNKDEDGDGPDHGDGLPQSRKEGGSGGEARVENQPQASVEDREAPASEPVGTGVGDGDSSPSSKHATYGGVAESLMDKTPPMSSDSNATRVVQLGDPDNYPGKMPPPPPQGSELGVGKNPEKKL